jgi:hypothetical protein
MSDQTRPWPRLSVLQRWGPAALVIVVCAALGAVATTRSPSGTSTEKAPTTQATLADNPELPRTYAEAKKGGTAGDTTWANCDTSTGKIKFPSVYAPPCVPKATGNNGGATYQGVTSDTITIVYYSAPANDITASIAGQLDKPAQTVATVKAYTKMFQAAFETYGRKVKVIAYTGSGIGTDETSARADAVKVATQFKAFASIGGPSQTAVYANELAARHVLCLGCGISVPNSAFDANAPYMWGTLSTPEQYLENIGVVLTRELNKKPAKWAGDPKMRTRRRVFGVIHYEQDPPVFTATSKVTEEQGLKYGWKAKVNLTYLLDLAKLPETAAGLIAKLKNAGVTTVVFLGDPIMPIYLTKAATAQNYFPEWVVTGTVLTDTTALARNYDPKQWAHAFGVSTLPVRTPQADADAYRTYRWYYGEMPAAFKTSGVIYPPLLQLYQGIQMAGPDLTPQTFAGGMFRLPPTGGQPGAPRVSYGQKGLFHFAKSDFVSVDDSTLIWWDPTATGKDEQGKDGTGMYRYVSDGKRYLPGKMPVALQPFFDRKNTITTFPGVPPALRTPAYPPPKGSPAAAKRGG